MNFSKKLAVSLLVLSMTASLAACGGGGGQGSAPSAAPSTAPVESTTPDANTPSGGGSSGGGASSAEFDGKLHGPFVMTTCGQSTGSVMCHMVATQAGVTSVDEHQLMASELDTLAPDAKTLIISTGTSGKGMGAAGTDVGDEIERCTAVAQAAKEKGMVVVCAHVEGMSRRTDANDQASIDAILPLADVIVCVEESDSDGLFSNYAQEHSIPIITAKDTLSLSDYMTAE
ncbi:hypothetical protein D1159_10080 [Pseudoflavonifractor sp. 524-17]|uniref:DUF6305 family protein n=1 Tax=Pseudoflavonifractor sp. 524-17 TaxID=2304577 RepID=UPI001379DB8D|nr:DUF6305 family protein [Pseudoflavonifractor sp. 524-17]NCE64923.1 hypothetical protein [Pseudoflavonifractor sp. 524-17]